MRWVMGILLSGLGVNASAQVTYALFGGPVDCSTPSDPEQVVWSLETDQAPSYPGGIDSAQAYVRSRVKHIDVSGCPAHSWVITQFTVRKDGSISDVEVVNSACAKADGNVKAAIGTMPNWTPGTCKKSPLNTRLMFPVRVT